MDSSSQLLQKAESSQRPQVDLPCLFFWVFLGPLWKPGLTHEKNGRLLNPLQLWVKYRLKMRKTCVFFFLMVAFEEVPHFETKAPGLSHSLCDFCGTFGRPKFVKKHLPLDPKTNETWSFRPSIYGLQPLKMKVAGMLWVLSPSTRHGFFLWNTWLLIIDYSYFHSLQQKHTCFGEYMQNI